jgi:hypothetical protein
MAAPPLPRAPVLHGAAAAVGLLIFGAYALSAHRGLGGGDSGELTMAAATLGVAHPPGYPLYVLLGHLAAALPGGTLCLRLNLFSGLCAAAAVALVFAALWRWSRFLPSALVGAGLFAFSPLVWRYAQVAEVFALNNLFAAGLLYAAVHMAERPRLRTALWSAVWLGFGVAHHQTLIFYGAAAALFIWRCLPPPRRLQSLAALAACTLVGFLPYLTLLWTGRQQPLLGWGQTDTLAGLLRHMLRSDYGTLSLSCGATAGSGSFFLRLGLYLRTLPAELSWAGLALCLVAAAHALGFGAGRGRLRQASVPKQVWQPWQRRLVGLWAGCWLLYVGVFTALSNIRVDNPLALEVQARFWQLANLPLCLLAGFGLWACVQWLPLHWRALGPAVAVAVVALQAGLHAPAQRCVQAQVLQDFGRAALRTVPPLALVVSTGDHLLGTLRYLQGAEQLRPDVAMVDAAQLGYSWSAAWMHKNFPDVLLPASGIMAPGGYTLADLALKNPGRPLVLCNWQSTWDTSVETRFVAWPWGLCRRLLLPGERPAQAAWQAANTESFAAFPIETADLYAPHTWEHYAAQQYWRELRYYGSELLVAALRSQPPAVDLLEAGSAVLEKVARHAGDSDADVYKNLGAAYQYLSVHNSHYTQRMAQAYRTYLKNCSPRCAPQEVRTMQAILDQVDAKPS